MINLKRSIDFAIYSKVDSTFTKMLCRAFFLISDSWAVFYSGDAIKDLLYFFLYTFYVCIARKIIFNTATPLQTSKYLQIHMNIYLLLVRLRVAQ